MDTDPDRVNIFQDCLIENTSRSLGKKFKSRTGKRLVYLKMLVGKTNLFGISCLFLDQFQVSPYQSLDRWGFPILEKSFETIKRSLKNRMKFYQSVHGTFLVFKRVVFSGTFEPLFKRLHLKTSEQWPDRLHVPLRMICVSINKCHVIQPSTFCLLSIRFTFFLHEAFKKLSLFVALASVPFSHQHFFL